MIITVDQAREKMTRIRAALKSDLDSIRADHRLTDEGRKLEMAKALRTHRKQAATLREQFSAQAKARRKELHQRLFGLPADADALAFRDALDRAENLTSEEQADKALHRAELVGDTLLARAIAGRAHEKGWRDITRNHFTDTAFADNLTELEGLRGGSSSIGETALFSVIPPHEIATLTSDDRVEDYIARAERNAPTHNGRQLDPTGVGGLTR